MVIVAPNPQDPVAVDGYDDAARGGADPAIRELVALHRLTLWPICSRFDRRL